ncbi:hypothetical protein HGA91_05300 [candidate division WWE3 bacterium]|nr:hypothetical protein [candidate division WWE3 bacterium]
MFKSKGGIDRLLHMNKISLPGNANISLSADELSLIEETTVLSIYEKVHLILIALGYKLTGEVFNEIDYQFDETTQRLEPNESKIKILNELFLQLPFPFFVDELEKNDRKTGLKKRLVWLQICVNERVKYYMQHYAESLTEMEDGVLYGYPISAIRAYASLIDVTTRLPRASIARWYVGAGRPSVALYEAEEVFYTQVWQEVSQISPRLVNLAEGEYYKTNKT